MRTDSRRTARDLRDLLPYLKDWRAWQTEIRRLEKNIIKLRKNGYWRLAKTLERSLLRLKLVLAEERKEHAFTVNKLVREIDRRQKRSHRPRKS